MLNFNEFFYYIFHIYSNDEITLSNVITMEKKVEHQLKLFKKIIYIFYLKLLNFFKKIKTAFLLYKGGMEKYGWGGEFAHTI